MKKPRGSRYPSPFLSLLMLALVFFSVGAVSALWPQPELQTRQVTNSSTRTKKATQPTEQVTASTPVSTSEAANQTTSSPQVQPRSTSASTPQATPKASTKPSATKPSANSGYNSQCITLLSQYYVAYQADIKRAQTNHEAILKELKQDYDEGVYDIGYPPDAAQPYNDYQADIHAENARWNQETLTIQQSYNTKLRSAGCSYSI